MEFKTLNMGQYKALLIGLVISVLLCIYLITNTMNKNIELQSIQARCSLAEQAVRHPAKTKNNNIRTFTRTVYVNLTEQEKEQICKDYDLRMDYLTHVINSMQENISITQDNSTEITEPKIPQDNLAIQTKQKIWSAGLIGINDEENKKIGIAVNRDISKSFEINAGISNRMSFAGILVKF